MQIKLFENHAKKFFGEKNVAGMKGREWKFHRAVVLKAFAPSTVNSNRANIASITNNAVASVRARIKDSSSNGNSATAVGGGGVVVMARVVVVVVGIVLVDE